MSQFIRKRGGLIEALGHQAHWCHLCAPSARPHLAWSLAPDIEREPQPARQQQNSRMGPEQRRDAMGHPLCPNQCKGWATGQTPLASKSSSGALQPEGRLFDSTVSPSQPKPISCVDRRDYCLSSRHPGTHPASTPRCAKAISRLQTAYASPVPTLATS